jgi:hypothetical protein
MINMPATFFHILRMRSSEAWADHCKIESRNSKAIRLATLSGGCSFQYM